MDRPFPIVGVGASAGGVEALDYLFKAMPPEPSTHDWRSRPNDARTDTTAERLGAA